MDRPIDPYAEHEAKTRQWWASLSVDEQWAFVQEIGIVGPDGKLTPEYDHRPEEVAVQIGAK